METVQINTTQNVVIDYDVAGLGDRIVAALIDYLILAGYFIGIMLFVGLLGGFLEAGKFGQMAIPILIFLPYVFYDLICETAMNGQSFGKKAMKIKVAKMDGSAPGIGDYLLRWLLRFIDVSLTSGAVAVFTILINGKGQRLGDLAANTTVIKLKPKVQLKDTILTELEDGYRLVFSQVALLNDQDITIIKKVLNAKVEDSKMENHLAYKTKVALEKKMGVKSDLLAKSFLETVLKDYNALVRVD